MPLILIQYHLIHNSSIQLVIKMFSKKKKNEAKGQAKIRLKIRRARDGIHPLARWFMVEKADGG